jgi:NTP pyrophosphatase (non-canonical NTP hydrolase)
MPWHWVLKTSHTQEQRVMTEPKHPSMDDISEFDGPLLKTCGAAILHFGVPSQISKAIEELSELSTELARHQNKRAMNVDIIDEIADCVIMLVQLTLIFGEDLVDKKIADKIARLKTLMEP